VVFLAWLKEAYDKQFRALVSKHGDHTAAAMYDLLETSVNPDPTPEEKRHILVLTARFSESSDALIQAAFRHVALFKLDPSVNLPHLYSAMSLVILLLRIPSVNLHPAIFTKHSVTTVARVFAFLACEGADIRSDRDKKRVLNMASFSFRDEFSWTDQPPQCSLVVQYCCFYLNDAFMRKDSTPWIAPAVDAGFLSGIVAAQYWMSDEFSSIVQGPRSIQLLRGALKFCEETVVGYLWLYPVFEAVSAVVDDMRRKNTLGTSEFIRALARLVLSWRPLAAQVRSRCDLKPSRCCYTKVSSRAPAAHCIHLIQTPVSEPERSSPDPQNLRRMPSSQILLGCLSGGRVATRVEGRRRSSRDMPASDEAHRRCVITVDFALEALISRSDKLPLTSARDIAFVQTVFTHEVRLHGQAAPQNVPVRGVIMEMRMGLPNPTCQLATDDPLILASTRTGAVGDKDRIPSASFDRWSDVLECGAHGYPVRITLPASVQRAKPECPSVYFVQDITDLRRLAIELDSQPSHGMM
jgi:hypothetical protein